MNVAILVPRRADGGRRDRLWEHCRAWWAAEFPDWAIVEGHHDDGPFNRSAAINDAAARAHADDVILVVDADVLAAPAQVAKAVEQAAGTGRLTLAYTRYVALDDAMTGKVLAGYDGRWESGRTLKMTTHVSSILAVPRSLWERVGGFDDRFRGWGHDDIAFAQACRVLGGGIDRVDGTVYHLWHPPAGSAEKRTADYRASSLLARRYANTTEPEVMRRLVDERSEPDGVVLVVLTHGRRDCIATTIPSALEQLHGLPIVRTVIVDDSGDLEYQAWLRLRFLDWELVTGKAGGFAVNVRRAWDTALGSGQRLVFWLEDDFTFEQPVDLAAMAAVLDANPHLVQMALRRQAWFPGEVDAGGVVEQHPDAYADCTDGTNVWLEHELFVTTNPHLTTRDVLAAHEWPNRAHSESLFARAVLRDGRRAGYWGARTDPPWVHHFGERTGSGY